MAEDIAMIFEHPAAGVAVRLSRRALDVIRKQALVSGRDETGGILIGRYHNDGSIAVVTGATAGPTDSVSGTTWFQRGVRGLRELLRDRWPRGEYYLGEWHSHPGGAPDPSRDDFREMRSISIDSSYRCPKPLLVIAGTSAASVELSVSVIDEGRLVRLQRSSTSSAGAAI